MISRRCVLVQDEIEAKEADVWWFMHTKADVVLGDNGRTATLSLNGKNLQARILAGRCTI